jgi:hypothetical protein
VKSAVKNAKNLKKKLTPLIGALTNRNKREEMKSTAIGDADITYNVS